MKKYCALLLVLLLTISCNEYQKVLKNEDVAAKYTFATKMYETEKYNKAIRLFEQIMAGYRGKPQAERLFYMLSQSYYKSKQNYLAAYQFESFVSSYPKSENIEEAAFLVAKSFSKLSPVYSLDQTDTHKAIEKTQDFIDKYPNSEFVKEANEISKTLTEKIEKKSFENAKAYYIISDFKSAIVSFDLFINEYPGTKFKEDALFYKYDAAYQLAINSVVDKMFERLKAAKTHHASLMKFKEDTKYKATAEEMLARIDKDLEKFTK